MWGLGRLNHTRHTSMVGVSLPPPLMAMFSQR